MYMRKVCCTIFILISILVMVGCEKDITNNYNTLLRRLSDNYSNWAKDAIGELNGNKKTEKVIIAVIDTGYNGTSEKILECIDVIDSNKQAEDECGHGTYIANNIINMYENIYVIPIKVTNNGEKMDISILIKAINIAIEKKVDVINISLGVEETSDGLYKAISKATNSGIIVVAAAGNGGGNILYPARYKEVISVMARDINNIDLSFNGKNESKKSFSAPGEHIKCGNEYVTGTSIATSFITAAVAYIKSVRPEYTLEEVVDIIIQSSNYPNEYSYGIINYNRLVDLLK